MPCQNMASTQRNLKLKKFYSVNAGRWMIADKERKGIDVKKGGYSTAQAKLTSIWNKPIQEIKLVHLQAIIDENEPFKSVVYWSYRKRIEWRL